MLSRYIALNPVKAGICQRPEEWKWSSYAARAGFAEVPGWLTLAPLARQLGADPVSQQLAYREFVLAGAGLTDDQLESSLAGMFVGTAGWIDRIQRVIDQIETERGLSA